MRKLVLLVAAVGLLTATSAQAATWKVAVGEQSPAPAGLPKMATLNMMMPGSLSIHVGDKVTFSSMGFHTAAYIPGGKPPAIFLPDPSKAKYSGIKDAAGDDFYFDNSGKFIYNGQVFAPTGGTSVTGKAAVSSGVIAPKSAKSGPATATFSFPSAGTYQFICTVHPNMRTNIVVKAAGTAVPKTPSQVQGQILSQQAAAWKSLKQDIAKTKVPPLTVYAGIGTDRTVLGYFPQTLKVKVGTMVSFVSKTASEPHNIAFGPKSYLESFSKKYDLLPQGPNSPNQALPTFIYGSDPDTVFQYNGSNHGNGFLAGPLMVNIPNTNFPKVVKVMFTKAGTYKYICQLHGPDMSGTIVVSS